MNIFIDESGNFVDGSDWGIVCALTIPHRELGPLRRELQFRTRAWPREHGELKGRLLDPIHIHALVDILHRHSALLHCCAMCFAYEDKNDLEAHKRGQCDGITSHLTDEHHPDAVQAIWGLRRTLEQMPLQLYLQCVVQSELVASVVEDTVIYFSQRRPRELGRFEWVIDAKDASKITTQEKWWRDTLGPLMESRSMRQPLKFVRDADFDVTHFKHSYEFDKDQWYPDKPRELIRGIDIRKIIMDCVSFNDSRTDIILQAIDILANYLRRVLSNRMQDDDVARSLGRLQLPRRSEPKGPYQGIQIITLSRSMTGRYKAEPELKRNLDLMASSGRMMILRNDRTRRRANKAKLR